MGKNSDTEERKLKERVLEASRALRGLSNGGDWHNHIKQSFALTLTEVTKLKRGTLSKKKWDSLMGTDFFRQERQYLQDEIQKLDTLKFNSVKYNLPSVKNLIDDICKEDDPVEYCFFLNVQLNINQFFLPQIQFHLALQKCIEQRLNFIHVSNCLKNSDHNQVETKIIACKSKPPGVKLYRLLFLEQTEDELGSQPVDFKNNLSFLCSIHHLLSIQLGLLPLNRFADYIGNGGSFIRDEDMKTVLGLSKLDNDSAGAKLKKQIKGSYNEQKGNENSLDYLFVKKENNSNSCIWIANDDSENGLTYKKLEGDQKNRITFAQRIYEHTLKETSSSTTDHSELDPYHVLFKIDKEFDNFFNPHVLNQKD